MSRPWSVLAVFLVLGAPAAAQTPRTPWGDPDLQGTFTTDNSIGVPLERPKEFGTRATLTAAEYAAREKTNAEQVTLDQGDLPESKVKKDDAPNNAPRHWLERPARPSRATSLVIDPPDGRIPALTAEAQQRAADQRARRGRGLPASTADFSNYDRCISRGVVGSILPAIYGNGTSILQAPGYVVIRNEMIHETRVISLDGRRHISSEIAMWMGDARGRWDGDTLVVDSSSFTDRTGIGGATHSKRLHLVERLTRVDSDTVRYEVTVDDPATYTRPWTVRVDLDQKKGYEIFEYACHEGNYGLRNMLSAARAEEK
jgi:hypothetical protein